MWTPPPDNIQHVCLRVSECLRACVHNCFLFFVQKKSPRILKHFGFCILKCFISFSLLSFLSFHWKLESNFFFFSFLIDICLWLCPLFSSAARPSVVGLAAAWQQCTAQRSEPTECWAQGRTERERARERDLQPASQPTWTCLWNNFHVKLVSCCDDQLCR